ncbi:MAG: pentapeptide repeat-containing protein [Methylovulum sp.]|nr:pentapeptide repeat-containing protein [Methylovulum sp.]MCF7999393.1 pentapeptide repeat-containing protein [Methylovulum sp.]
MNKRTLLLTTLPLLGGLALGAAYLVMSSNPPDFTATVAESSKIPVLSGITTHQLAEHNQRVIANIPRITSSENTATPKHTQKTEKLSGIFRGDWGETPVYAAHDRVNFEGAAYLSLLDDNKNQQPSLNSAYWRMVKAAKLKNAEDCWLIGPDAHLDTCDFTQANSLKDRDLQGADLSQALLSGDLGAANLNGANLSGAAVIGSLLISPDTQMDHVNLSGLQSDGNNPLIAEAATMNKANFSNANLYGANFKAATLTDANLTGATLTGADMRASHMEAADLSKTDLTYARLSEASFIGATLNKADLTEANLSKANFSTAALHNANLAGANLAETNLSGADLSGVNLTDAQSTNSALIDSGTNFTAAICPDGVVVDGRQATTCLGHGF